MKTKMKIISLVLMLCIGAWISPQKTAAQGGSVSFQVFYDDLSPYGTWVNNPNYGYVWIPDAGPGFTPYATNGYWVLTDMGWTWVSNYSWGWAPFHYGRWYTDAVYGPVWVPGNEWGPGWVTWRRSSDYYGWAPIGPGVSLNVAYSNGYDVPYNQWTFVRGGNLGRTNINNYYVNNSTNVTIINNTTVINNTRMDKSRNVTYNAGPDRHEVEKHAGKTFTPVAIQETSKPGQHLNNNQLQIYRPQVQKTAVSGPKPAPARVESLNNVKPASQRTASPAQHNAQPAKQQPAPAQHNAQPAKQQPAPAQHNAQPAKQQPAPAQHNAQPAKQQPAPAQHEAQPAKQQPTPAQHNTQPAPPQHEAQPAKQQPAPAQHEAQPTKHQAPPPQQKSQPAKQKPSQPTNNPQPPKEQQPQQNAQPTKQQQPQQDNPPKKGETDKETQQTDPPKTMLG
jgi:hypothetical protein